MRHGRPVRRTREPEQQALRQTGVREHNLGLVLRHLASSPRPISRADLAAATGLTRATVSALVEDLISGRLVSEVAPAPRTGAGRPANGLRLAGDGPAGLGLEINVDYLAACVVDLSGEVRHHVVRHADQRPRPPEQVLAAIARLATEAVEAVRPAGLHVVGAALAVPGLVSNRGEGPRAQAPEEPSLIHRAPNLGWRDVPVPARLAGLPVRVDNEANLAALGERQASRTTDFIYVSGEIGIGAGIVLDGRLFRGGRGFSGEIGHVTIHPDGPVCRCGARGCLEQYAGQERILAAAGAPTVESLVERAGAGEPGALRALQDAGTALGVAAAGVVNLLDLDTVVLGGSYAALAPWLCDPVAEQIRQRVVTAGWAPVTVRAAALGSRATVVGAAGSVVRAIHDAPARWLNGAWATGASR
ncbi:MAG: ROK family protein [Micromonosporaceae bacterium]|jgi:predicted NBD/HSP70 family sugar kinase|nr:ROK family protein [Micromonosporaceae bacterium]